MRKIVAAVAAAPVARHKAPMTHSTCQGPSRAPAGGGGCAAGRRRPAAGRSACGAPPPCSTSNMGRVMTTAGAVMAQRGRGLHAPLDAQDAHAPGRSACCPSRPGRCWPAADCRPGSRPGRRPGATAITATWPLPVLDGDQGHHGRGGQADHRGQAVHAVDQVQGIDAAQQPQDGQRDAEPAQVDAASRRATMKSTE